MEIADASGPRFELAVELFLGGHSLAYEGVALWKDPAGVLIVSSYSDCVHVENASVAEAEEKIARSKEVVKFLCSKSPELSAIAQALPHRYEFCYDYGTGAVRLAWEEAGAIKWRG